MLGRDVVGLYSIGKFRGEVEKGNLLTAKKSVKADCLKGHSSSVTMLTTNAGQSEGNVRAANAVGICILPSARHFGNCIEECGTH